MSIILFVAVLAILILAHELGHFIAAKKSGIRVDEFGIGFPPRLFKIKKGETIYSINLIPFGGFVKIHGEDGSTGSPQGAIDPRSFAAKSIGIRALVISAGVIFNVIFAWLVITVAYSTGMPSSVSAVPAGAEVRDSKIIILNIQNDSPAEESGLKAGDQLLNFSSTDQVFNFIEENKGKEIEINYKRGDETFTAKTVPRINPPEGQGALGIMMDEIGIVKIPWHRAILESLKITYQMTIAMAVAIFYFIVGAIKGLVGFDQILGPVGIVSATGTFAKIGFAYVLNFMAILSLNLAILNILPFPALDGGRLLFLLIEKIKGSPVSHKITSITHGVGLIILLILMAAITYNDILRLI
ncbi:RIP metalloprotease RseP [Patescibacteria group bacterium]|nr:RIP metalloprotease RseP [Patescibacteria group bacterium]